MFRIYLRVAILALIFSPLSAQQNLFNVPNGDITDPGKFFFQEQANISANTVQSNTTVDYGLPNNFEVGLNLFFLNFATELPARTQLNTTNDTIPASPLLMANAQKGFSPRNWLHFSLGGQAGANLGDVANTKFAYNGSGNGFLMGGIEFPVFARTFHLIFDIIQGSHANAVFVPGLLYYFSERVGLSIGWQKPFPASATEQAIVFELSLF